MIELFRLGRITLRHVLQASGVPSLVLGPFQLGHFLPTLVAGGVKRAAAVVGQAHIDEVALVAHDRRQYHQAEVIG